VLIRLIRLADEIDRSPVGVQSVGEVVQIVLVIAQQDRYPGRDESNNPSCPCSRPVESAYLGEVGGGLRHVDRRVRLMRYCCVVQEGVNGESKELLSAPDSFEDG